LETLDRSRMPGSELNLFKTAKRGKIVAILPLSVAGYRRRHL